MTKRVVHHYPVPSSDPARIMVPGGSKIVSAAMRRNGPAVYVEKIVGEASTAKEVPMDVVFVGTGHEFEAWGLDHIATLTDGPFVWHVYGRINHG